MIDQIAIWTSRHSIGFAEFAKMVEIASRDREYWGAQPISRLYAEAINAPTMAPAKAPLRV